MVHSMTIGGLAFALAVSVLTPLLLFIYFRRKEYIPFLPAFVGALTFVVFSQLLEKLLHLYVFTQNPYTMNAVKNPWIFALYGALAAGTFEGIGRYVSLQYLLRNLREWRDGLSFGIGYGGIESMLIGASAFGQLLYFASLMNSGPLPGHLIAALPSEALAQIETALLQTPAHLWLLGGFERLLALNFQIAMALLLLYGLRQGKHIYLLWTIAIHAFFDFFPAMYQAKLISIMAVEGLLTVFSLGALIFIIKSKSLFRRRKGYWR